MFTFYLCTLKSLFSWSLLRNIDLDGLNDHRNKVMSYREVGSRPVIKRNDASEGYY